MTDAFEQAVASASYPSRGWRCRACKEWESEWASSCRTCGRYVFQHSKAETHNAAHGAFPKSLAEMFGRPLAMSTDEHALRVAVLESYLLDRASEWLARLAEFADWLEEHDHPEYAAARAKWVPLDTAKPITASDPRSWWYWSVTVSEGWWMGYEKWWMGYEKLRHTIYSEVSRRAGVTASQHNGRWFLGFPPGWVRFTQPGDCGWWRLTIQPCRSLGYSKPYELVHPAGYARLFYPPDARWEGGAARDRLAGSPGLFDAGEE